MLNILFCGDVCFKEQYDLIDADTAKPILSDVKPIFDSSDLLVMNLETPLFPEGMGAPIPKAGPNIQGRPKNIGFLTEAGCDCATLANNHTKDFGEEPLMYTISLLDEQGIAHPGAGRNIDEAYTAWRTEKNGVRLSLISVCENEFGIADIDLSGTAGLEMNRLAGRIAEERKVSDIVIVMCHGGNEYNPLPSPGCRDRYRLITRLGADAVIAGHTHCPQGYEYYDGKPIVYSMGNFFFKYASIMSPWWYCGYMTRLIFDGGRLSVEPIPYTFDPDGTHITPLTGEKKEIFGEYLRKISAPITDDTLIADYYDGWSWQRRDFLKRYADIKDDYFDPENGPVNCAGLYNYIICEAHRELCGNIVKLIFNGRLKHAEEWSEKLNELKIDRIYDKIKA